MFTKWNSPTSGVDNSSLGDCRGGDAQHGDQRCVGVKRLRARHGRENRICHNSWKLELHNEPTCTGTWDNCSRVSRRFPFHVSHAVQPSTLNATVVLVVLVVVL